MSASLNRAQLIGHLGKDPEIRYTQSGTAVGSFSIATSEKFKNKAGEYEERTEWHNVVLWGKLAEIAGEYLQKGKQVYIEGRLQTRKWQDRDGVDRYTTEIVGEKMLMLGSPGGNRAPHPAETGTQSGRYDPLTGKDVPDDDIPF